MKKTNKQTKTIFNGSNMSFLFFFKSGEKPVFFTHAPLTVHIHLDTEETSSTASETSVPIFTLLFICNLVHWLFPNCTLEYLNYTSLTMKAKSVFSANDSEAVNAHKRGVR